MTLSLSTMWAQQERFVADMHVFVEETRGLGYDAIEVSHSTPLPQFEPLRREVVQPLVDLVEQVGTRATLVLVAQFEEHLAEPPDGPYRVVGIVFPDRMRVPRRKSRLIVAWQSCNLSREQ